MSIGLFSQVLMKIPFPVWSIKLEAVLSTMIVFLMLLKILLRSFMWNKCLNGVVCYLYILYDIRPFGSKCYRAHSAYFWDAAVNNINSKYLCIIIIKNYAMGLNNNYFVLVSQHYDNGLESHAYLKQVWVLF